MFGPRAEENAEVVSNGVVFEEWVAIGVGMGGGVESGVEAVCDQVQMHAR